MTTWGASPACRAAYAGGGTLTSTYYVNDLTRSQTQDGLTNTYDLDAAYRQRKRTQSGTKTGTQVYHYPSGGDSPIWTEEGATWTRNIAALGGSLGGIQKSSGETTLQLADMHGDVVATASLSPLATKPLSTLQFDEFGNPKQSGGAEYGWLGASTRRTQLPSGVIQMGVRSYVPALGRFLTPDPVRGGSANAYDYANQDPINDVDLTGEWSACITKAMCKRLKAVRKLNRKTRRRAERHGVAAPVKTRKCTAIACTHDYGEGGHGGGGIDWGKIKDKVGAAAAKAYRNIVDATLSVPKGRPTDSVSLEISIRKTVGSEVSQKFAGCVKGAAESYLQVPKDVWDLGKKGTLAGRGWMVLNCFVGGAG